MPRIAILADVHGNFPALEAVLADIDREAPDEVLVGGDLVGRGPEGSRVVRAIRERGWPSIRGNHEEYLLDFRRGRVPSEWHETEEWAASRWMAAELATEDVDYIAALPFSLAPAGGEGLTLIHGSPRSVNEGLGPWTSDGKLGSHLAACGAAMLVCGHTHRPMHRVVSGGEVVNVGSVGLPFNRDRRAQYAIFESGESSESGGWTVEFRKVEYDVGETLAIYESSGFLGAGGVTARLLKLELEQAAPFLVPFLKWASLVGVERRAARIGEFLDFYDPDEPVHEFFRRLSALAEA